MAIIDVPWIKLPESKFKQLENGTKGIVFKLSPEYVGKILYTKDNNGYRLRDDEASSSELTHESGINFLLYKAGIGNVPKPIGVERLGIFGSAYYAFIMEYIKLKRADKLDHVTFSRARELGVKELAKALDLDLYPGADALNPFNFFYDEEERKVRLIDFGNWEIGQSYKENNKSISDTGSVIVPRIELNK